VIRQRLDEYAIHDAEDHRVETDADREAGDGQARNPLVFQRGAETVANILEQHAGLRRLEHRRRSGVH
jgi:hypothetical protein